MMGKILVIVTGADGMVRFANPNCEILLGYPPAEVAGQPLWQFLASPTIAQRMRAALSALGDGRAVSDDEGAWKHRDGHPVVLRWGYSVIPGAGGKADGFIFTAYDTERGRSVTAELAESLDRYQGILDTAVDGIITINERGIVESFNRAAERIFGYRAAEVIGHNVSMLMPAPYREKHDQYLDNYLTSRRKKVIGIGREVEGRRKDGAIFPLELSVGEVTTGDCRTFTGIVRDISDRKQAEADARRRMNEMAHMMRVRSMGDLASGLAHEVNQPLTAIISNAQACLRLIDSNRADPDIVRESLQQIARQGERAGEIIRRLRKYVEKGELEKSPADLNTSVVEVLELLSHELQVNRVRMFVGTAPQLPRLEVDRVQIEQVLLNLIRNAVEAMAEAGVEPAELHIETAEKLQDGAAGVIISVQDNGPGISSKDAETLFEPFYTTKSNGLGQGLSICRRIIQAHGGRIWAEQATPRGARFSFWLPCKPGP